MTSSIGTQQHNERANDNRYPKIWMVVCRCSIEGTGTSFSILLTASSTGNRKRFPCTAENMAYLLPHLHSGWEVDQAIVNGDDRVVVIRFGRDANTTCMIQDEILAGIAEKVKNFAVIYLVDLDEVPDFIHMYELYDDCTTMFFYRNKHIMVDLGTGDNNKINWPITNKQEFIDIVEIVYRGARKGRGLVISPKDYSTKYRY